ncbi:MAG TPA: sensor histidine kinase [Oscillospiraceae bacterium]|nr:sensor histidine kinase [Oscillospiraceae bacterium]
MENLSAFKLILKWLSECKVIIIMFSLFSVIGILMQFLYQVNVGPIFYSTFICAFIGIFIGIFSCHRYIRRYRQLYNAFINIENMLSLIPEPKKFSESSYQEIINRIYNDRLNIISQIDQQKSEMSDYYTLWAHQIKTPIAAAKLLINSDSIQSNRYSIEGELSKIEQYTEMVLHYLRIESISEDMVLKKYNIYDIVCHALKKFSIYFSASGLMLDFSEFECNVITDEKWMTVVIEQLLSNCIKYTKQGKITIKGYDDKLVISDTGIGISPEDLPRIFDRGFTGYNGRIYKKSTGIGLFLCRRITQQLGHAISVTSQVGKGTQFIVDFSSQKDSGMLQK